MQEEQDHFSVKNGGTNSGHIFAKGHTLECSDWTVLYGSLYYNNVDPVNTHNLDQEFLV